MKLNYLFAREYLNDIDGSAQDWVAILGNKGYNLTEMCRIGVRVPPGFILPASVGLYYCEEKRLPDGVLSAIKNGIKHIRNHWDQKIDLLLSVRSSFSESMPGMMDTILNIIPDDPEQIQSMVKRVLDSWDSKRARAYRELNGISNEHGVAVVVQAMVLGDLDEYSGTGVVFTRNPIDGSPEIFGEWLLQAQGDQLVSGLRTPELLNTMQNYNFNGLRRICKILEQHYTDVQDIEFTIQSNIIYILQTRTAKRTSDAALKIAVSMVHDGLIDKQTALSRVTDNQIKNILRPKIEIDISPLATGLAASPGVATGVIVLDASEMTDAEQDVILVRKETSPEDIMGMSVAKGVLTTIGGMTSHAAVVARGMDKPCIVGCSEITIRSDGIVINEILFKTGDLITIDGNTGSVYLGAVPVVEIERSGDIETFMKWKEEQ